MFKFVNLRLECRVVKLNFLIIVKKQFKKLRQSYLINMKIRNREEDRVCWYYRVTQIHNKKKKN